MANTIQIKCENRISALLDGELGYNFNLNTFNYWYNGNLT